MDIRGSLAIAIEAMYLLTLLPWEGVLRADWRVSAGQIPEEIYFKPTAAPGADEQMETQHMVLGLYVGCLNVAAQGFDLGYEIMVTTKMREEQLGLVFIRRDRVEKEEITHDQINSTLSLLGGEGRPVEPTASVPHGFTSNYGSMVDPEEADFKINYRFIGRQDASDPRDILLAALDALANATPFSSYARISRLTGTDGRSGSNAVIEVQRLTRTDPRAIQLTYRYAARAIQLILRLMKLRDRYQPIEFELAFGMLRFAEGSIMRPRARLEKESIRL